MKHLLTNHIHTLLILKGVFLNALKIVTAIQKKKQKIFNSLKCFYYLPIVSFTRLLLPRIGEAFKIHQGRIVDSSAL